MADFQNGVISGVLVFFFKQKTAYEILSGLVGSEMCIRDRPIALPKWPIFKIVLFLEYLVFFEAVFCTELFFFARRIDFCMFFGILIFDPK